MSEARKLLMRALDVLEEMRLTDCPDWELGDDIRAELQKPEPVECGEFEVKLGMMMQFFPLLPDGKYQLLAVRIDDE